MKQQVSAIGAALALALAAGVGSAGATGLDPVKDKGACCALASQAGEQQATFGDQTVGEQRNEASAATNQGNGNVNVSPAVAVGGDASSANSQGNGNESGTTIVQGNNAEQGQQANQAQGQSQAGGGGRSQSGGQSANLDDETVGEQRNEASAATNQGNGNVNVSPAVAGGEDGSRQGRP